MTKIIMVFFALVATIQVIKPLGWPGLKRRKDAWKLAVGGFLVTLFAVILAATEELQARRKARGEPPPVSLLEVGQYIFTRRLELEEPAAAQPS